jgi:predicted RNA binding protein YcfA (HicA-like mRNA interferase family)
VYIHAVKRKELERRLRGLGWTFQRHGGKHDVWASGDGLEINEKLAQAILRRAKERK